MDYEFITVLHNMKLDKEYTRGMRLSVSSKISNSPRIINNLLNKDPVLLTIGEHSYNELENTTYFYRRGTFSKVQTYEEMDTIGAMYTFYFLREAQTFVNNLWLVKDNGIYVRDGFLLTSKNKDNRTYKSSLVETFKLASGKHEKTSFNKKEIEMAKMNFDPFKLQDAKKSDVGGKYPDFSHFYKVGDPGRLERARYFVLAARSNAAPPMKIVFYFTALECLFSTSKSEINYKMAERIALLLEDSPKNRKELFHFIKKAYDHRSTIVHGSNFKKALTAENVADVSIQLDNLLRRIFTQPHEIFKKTDKEMDDFFLEKIIDR